MAVLRSAPGGNRLPGARLWIIAYVGAWIAPMPIGLAMVGLPLLFLWPFEALGVTPPFESIVKLVFGIGWLVLFAPALSWMGLILSVPIVWVLLRLGYGGWVMFGLAGMGIGALVASMIGGMHPLAPTLLGAGSALIFRLLLSWMRPDVFLVKKS